MEKDIQVNPSLQAVKDCIKKAYEVTGGSCGITAVVIIASTGIAWKELQPILLQLHTEKYFKVKKGINGRLYFYNENQTA